MTCLKQMLWFFSLVICMLYSCSFKSPSSENEFSQKLLADARSCIEYNQEIPISQKLEIYTLLNQLASKRCIVESGSDDLRIKYVNCQGCIEHVLACAQALGEIDQLIGVIHTPTPATPLCVKPDGNIQDILDESIRNDLHKLLTVRSRAQIVREYLLKQGKLYVVYPNGGLQKRSLEQQSIYRDELARFEGRLIDCELSFGQLLPDIIGATYLFSNSKGQIFAFSIKARQVNDIQSQAEWGLWFGSIQDPQIIARVNEVFDYLSEAGGPDPRQEIGADLS